MRICTRQHPTDLLDDFLAFFVFCFRPHAAYHTLYALHSAKDFNNDEQVKRTRNWALQWIGTESLSHCILGAFVACNNRFSSTMNLQYAHTHTAVSPMYTVPQSHASNEDMRGMHPKASARSSLNLQQCLALVAIHLTCNYT